MRTQSWVGMKWAGSGRSWGKGMNMMKINVKYNSQRINKNKVKIWKLKTLERERDEDIWCPSLASTCTDTCAHTHHIHVYIWHTHTHTHKRRRLIYRHWPRTRFSQQVTSGQCGHMTPMHLPSELLSLQGCSWEFYNHMSCHIAFLFFIFWSMVALAVLEFTL